MKSTIKVRQSKAPLVLVAFGVALLCAGSFWGLAKAPSEVYMGDVQRIMYVHVPTAWNAMLTLVFAFGCALMFLFTNSWEWDNRLEASMEMGVVLSMLLCTQGAIWAKPTWGVWWDWDPRLTTTAVMVFASAASSPCARSWRIRSGARSGRRWPASWPSPTCPSSTSR